MNAAYREAFAEKPPVRTTIAVALPGRASIMMSAIAVPNGAARETLHPAGWMKSPRPYSYIVKAAGFVFLSGLVSRRGTDDQVVPGPSLAADVDDSRQRGRAAQDRGPVVRGRRLVTCLSRRRVVLRHDERRVSAVLHVRTPCPSDGGHRTHGPDAVVEISLIASEHGKQVVGPAVAPSLPLSTAVRCRRSCCFSPACSATPTPTPATSPRRARRSSRGSGGTLESLGLSFSHVVDNLVYLPTSGSCRNSSARARESVFARFRLRARRRRPAS
jgi:enamine deaminase RidA (YjgF/YER057c/UK114 family)